jgi:phenylpyruvate tautomerase PptA (4-oxalocrotonate tautomerase family)
MFAGRSAQVKKQLIRSLFAKFESELGISPQDLEISIHESPKENWGIRGQPGDELKLPYKVEK